MECSFWFLWNAENSPRNFLVVWNFGTSEEYHVVHGAEHVGFAYRRLLAHSTPPPLISNRDKLIKTSVYHLLHTVCCSEARALRLGCRKHVILCITDSFQHVDVYTFEWAHMSGSEVDGEHVNQQDVMEMRRSLVLRQGQL